MRAITSDPRILYLEVGAGSGTLTERLAAKGLRVVAYEVDPDWASRLATSFAGSPNVSVAARDFLSIQEPAETFAVVGNVPFSITTKIVRWCLSTRHMKEATLITQLEFAKKHSGGYGRWSLLTITSWPNFSWELRGSIARDEFRPIPRVNGGILHIGRREASLLPQEAMPSYVRLVELGFSGVGGSLAASLSTKFPRRRVVEAFRATGVDTRTVVAFVEPDQWIAIFTELESV